MNTIIAEFHKGENSLILSQENGSNKIEIKGEWLDSDLKEKATKYFGRGLLFHNDKCIHYDDSKSET